MNKSKIIDCITFFDNTFMFDFRFNILKDYVDMFVICESKYNNKNNIKKLNFDKNFINKKKVRYIVLEKPFPNKQIFGKTKLFKRIFIGKFEFFS